MVDKSSDLVMQMLGVADFLTLHEQELDNP